MSELPKLFKKNANGKVMYWSGEINDKGTSSDIIIKHGQVGGKEQVEVITISSGKNIGKKNETTPYQQALVELNSKWKKKVDKGYTENKEDIDEIVIRPMLAQEFKTVKKTTFPYIAQPKIDGVRALWVDGELRTRGNTVIQNFDFIEKQLKNIPLILDGELYSFDMSFENISGTVRTKKMSTDLKKKLDKMVYVIYDVVLDAVYTERYKVLEELCREHKFNRILLIENTTISSKDEIRPLHDKFVRQGYEGLMLRSNVKGYELNKRTNNLIKVKDTTDSEFEIVGYKPGEPGRYQDGVIWICKSPKVQNGGEFTVKPATTYEKAKWYLQHADEFIGKQLTVQFKGWLPSGLPREPVGKDIRDYE